MSITHRYRVSVALPASRPAVRDGEPGAARPAKSVVFSGPTGALTGTAAGKSPGTGAAGPVRGLASGS
jgi:hypothetical protein